MKIKRRENPHKTDENKEKNRRKTDEKRRDAHPAEKIVNLVRFCDHMTITHKRQMSLPPIVYAVRALVRLKIPKNVYCLLSNNIE